MRQSAGQFLLRTGWSSWHAGPMTQTAELLGAVSRYAERFHAAAGSTHHIASPLGGWLVVALAAPAGRGRGSGAARGRPRRAHRRRRASGGSVARAAARSRRQCSGGVASAGRRDGCPAGLARRPAGRGRARRRADPSPGRCVGSTDDAGHDRDLPDRDHAARGARAGVRARDQGLLAAPVRGRAGYGARRQPLGDRAAARATRPENPATIATSRRPNAPVGSRCTPLGTRPVSP